MRDTIKTSAELKQYLTTNVHGANNSKNQEVLSHINNLLKEIDEHLILRSPYRNYIEIILDKRDGLEPILLAHGRITWKFYRLTENGRQKRIFDELFWYNDSEHLIDENQEIPF